jgi:hypothetical protein
VSAQGIRRFPAVTKGRAESQSEPEPRRRGFYAPLPYEDACGKPSIGARPTAQTLPLSFAWLQVRIGVDGSVEPVAARSVGCCKELSEDNKAPRLGGASRPAT